MRVRRLTGSADFERVRSVGQAGSTPLFVAIAARGVDGPARVGVAAGKRVGGAAQRNRAKRLLREGVRPLYPFIDAGWDVLLLARKPILDTLSTMQPSGATATVTVSSVPSGRPWRISRRTPTRSTR